jgi:hypothetical protein
MPKIRNPPPPRILDHLIKRFHDGRISATDFLEPKHWLESDPDVPQGKWYKRFKTGTLAGHGSSAVYREPRYHVLRNGQKMVDVKIAPDVPLQEPLVRLGSEAAK